VGDIKLEVPKLRKLPFESAVIERYKRREISIEEALIEMYLAGVSVRRIEDITEALWGARVSAGTISNLNQKAYANIEEWRNQPISGTHPYVYLDGIWLKRSWGGEMRNLAILVAIGVNEEGFREILGVAEGGKEDKECWLGFLRHLKTRGLTGTELFVSDKCLGLVESIAECFPNARWQRCVVHFYRNVFSVVPRGRMKEVAAMLKAIHAQENREAASEKAEQVVAKLKEMRLADAAVCVSEGIIETLAYMTFPREHWTRLRTSNGLERLMREIRRRTRVVGNFPDGQSALMLVAARLRYIVGTDWGCRRYLGMELLKNHLLEMKMKAA
jgi:transposase-like protein